MMDCDIRRDLHVPKRIAHEYGVDKTGTITYEFNSLGYRGEEYDPAAKFKICVIGESYAFGVGVDLKDTFGHKLKQHIAASLCLDPCDVNLVNFGVGGASADYCVRTLYRQLAESTVDLLICQLPPANRTEYFDGKIFHAYAVNAVTSRNRQGAPIPLVAFCDYYNEQVGRIGLIKNVLLMQAFLKERGIAYVLAAEDELLEMLEADDLKDYLDWLDPRHVLLHRYFVSKADRAAGGTNAGPRCHAAFAIELLSFYGRMQLERGNNEIGDRILQQAQGLKQHDQDWNYCNTHISKRNLEHQAMNK